METSDKIFMGLLICIFILIFIAWILFLDVSLKLHRGYKIGMAKQDQCGEYYLEGESVRATIYEAFIKSEKQLKVAIDLTYMSLVLLMIGLGIMVFMNYKTSTSADPYFKPLSIVSIVYLAAMSITILALFKKPGDTSLNVFDIVTYMSAQETGSVQDGKKRILKNQLPVLLLSTIAIIAACVVLGLYSENFGAGMLTTVIVSIGIILILLPIISQDIYDLKSMIGNYYEDKTDTLNNTIFKEYKKNTDLEQHIRINMRSLDNLEEFPVISSENKNTLYRYVTNGSTLSDLKNISIPLDLASEIQPNYMAGENIFVLKSDLLTYYNKPSEANLKPLKKYFKTGINEKKLKELLEKYVLKNDTYKLSNAIPSQIRTQLQALRLNTKMETIVKKYTKKITTVSLILFIIAFYAFFHVIYQSSEVVVPQIMVMISLILLMIIGFTGWFFKELWL